MIFYKILNTRPVFTYQKIPTLSNRDFVLCPTLPTLDIINQINTPAKS